MLHEDYKEMLAAHALIALDAEDARALKEHLHACADCRSELGEWEVTAASLSFEAKPSEPSPQLRARIMEAVRADSMVGKRATSEATGSQASNLVALPQSRVTSWSAAQTWGAIAASLVFVVLAASLFVLWKQNSAARRELARLSNQVTEAQQQIARQREAIEIVATPGTRMSELAGTKMMPGAHAMLAYDKNGRAILMAKGLPPAPAGKAYQLWFIAGGRPMPGKVFTTDASGAGTLNDLIPAEALDAAVFAITMEPESGVAAPTGAIYLSSGT
jgi:anti-sigma-K factor RskA